MPGDGKLVMTVWPAWCGVAFQGALTGNVFSEPHNGNYSRGQITWGPDENGQIVGRARIICPPGTFTHFTFHKSPVHPVACGVSKMDFAITFTEPVNILDVYPIYNGDLALSLMTEVHP